MEERIPQGAPQAGVCPTILQGKHPLSTRETLGRLGLLLVLVSMALAIGLTLLGNCLVR